MKAVVDADTRQILGCAILGIEGGELMSMLEIAITGKVPYTALKEAIFATRRWRGLEQPVRVAGFLRRKLTAYGLGNRAASRLGFGHFLANQIQVQAQQIGDVIGGHL